VESKQSYGLITEAYVVLEPEHAKKVLERIEAHDI